MSRKITAFTAMAPGTQLDTYLLPIVDPAAGATANANLKTSLLSLSATATATGLVNTATQSMAGAKTFTTSLSSPSITDSGLTATRVTFAGTGGLLSDSANLTFATATLTLGLASTATGVLTLANAGGATTTSIQAGNAAATRVFIMPVVDPTAGQALVAAAPSGNNIQLSYAAAPAGGTGAATQVAFWTGTSTLSGNAGWTFNSTSQTFTQNLTGANANGGPLQIWNYANSSGAVLDWYYEKGPSSSLVNDNWGFRYNQSSTLANHPFIGWGWESYYDNSGLVLLEHHWDFVGTPGATPSYRPFNFAINLSTNLASTLWTINDFAVIANGSLINTFEVSTSGAWVGATKLKVGDTSAPTYSLQIVGASTSGVYVGVNTASAAANDVFWAVVASNVVTGLMNPFSVQAKATLGLHSMQENQQATSTADSIFEVIVAGAGGDPYYSLTVSGATSWTVGVDNSVSDQFVIGLNAPGSGNDYLTISTAGAVTIPQTLTVSTLTNGRIALVGASGLITDDSGIVYDGASDSIGLSASTYRFTVSGAARNTVYIGISPTMAAGDIAYYANSAAAVTGSVEAFHASLTATTGVTGTITNTNTTSTANASFECAVASGAAGDPFSLYTITGIINVATGLDNSASDVWGVWAAANPGTNPLITINTASTFAATIPGSSLTIGVASSQTGTLTLSHASTANTTSITAGNATAAVNYTLPTAAPTVSGQLLSSTTGGVMSWVLGGSSILAVTPKTASPYNVLAADSGKSFNNSGAVGSVTFNLPAASGSGNWFVFTEVANQNIVIQLGAGDTLQVGSSVSSAAGTGTLSAIGSSIWIQDMATNKFFGIAGQGSITLA